MGEADVNILIQIPHHRTGVYVIYNPFKKMAYVGEGDVCERMAVHMTKLMNGKHNNKLNTENEKYFVMLSVINADYYKKRNITTTHDNEKPWIIHETIVMYVLREFGIKLYNGSEDGKDNIGYRRSFLINDDTTAEDLKTKTLSFLNEESKGVSNDWDDLIEKVKDELISSLFDQLKVYDGKFIRELDPKNWSGIKKELREKEDWKSAKSEKGIKTICNKLRQRKLTKEDIKLMGIPSISVEDTIKHLNDGDFDRFIFHKFGNYIGQTLDTIFRIKINDMEKVELGDLQGLDINRDRENEGICLWSARNINAMATRDILSSQKNEKKPRYMIMQYTSSAKNGKSDYEFEEINPRTGESLEDFLDRFKTNETLKTSFPKGYPKKEKKNYRYKKEEVIPLPLNMTPPFIEKQVKHYIALIVSEIKYFDGEINMDDLCHCFRSIYGGYSPEKELAYTNELAYTLGIQGVPSTIPANYKCEHKQDYSKATGHSSVSSICAKIKEDEKDKAISLLKKSKRDDKSDFTSFLIARLEYPYIITLVNDVSE